MKKYFDYIHKLRNNHCDKPQEGIKKLYAFLKSEYPELPNEYYTDCAYDFIIRISNTKELDLLMFANKLRFNEDFDE